MRSGPGHPAWNMALDEALLEAHAPGDPPVLRLYAWAPAGLSLGRFQPAAEVELPPGAALVRRPSGGAAIHHREDEVTYALVARYERFGSPRAAYEAVHAAVAAGLVALGVPLAPRARPDEAAGRHGLCYARATGYDLVVGASKLVGSAQRRSGRAFLQHGSIPLSADPLVPSATSLSELLGHAPDPEQVATELLASFERRLGFSARLDQPTPDELARAERLLRERYATPAWTHAL
ncbi:MAG: biotin/lipoate A/B protein ligase family protein [Planctomycetota bacterium]